MNTPSEDGKAHNYIQGLANVGFDCEWVPDTRTANYKLSTVQICTGRVCYIWIMADFYRIGRTPRGLHSILQNPRILKVGCGMGNDFRKLAISGLGVCTTKLVKGKTKYIRPDHFYEVQRRSDKKGDQLPFDALEDLTLYWVKRKMPSTLNSRYIQWEDAQYDQEIQEYLVHDAYAVYLVYLYQTGQSERAEYFLYPEVSESSDYGSESSHDYNSWY